MPRLDLLDGGTNLLPSRYVAVRAEASADDLAGATERLTMLYAEDRPGTPVIRGTEAGNAALLRHPRRAGAGRGSDDQAARRRSAYR